MPAYVALLRAVNVGGTGTLPMADLRTVCETAGFTRVRTYIASGNVLFHSPAREPAVKKELERALEQFAGRPVKVHVRTAAEMANVLASNPFPEAASRHTLVIFLDERPSPADLNNAKNRKDERLALGAREIYVDYGSGMGRSKLKIPAAVNGTSRNMNTVAKLAALAKE
jgi:uncharacterized protein (DUF1697 family)